MRFETEALKDTCFYERLINSFYICMYVCYKLSFYYNYYGTNINQL